MGGWKARDTENNGTFALASRRALSDRALVGVAEASTRDGVNTRTRTRVMEAAGTMTDDTRRLR